MSLNHPVKWIFIFIYLQLCTCCLICFVYDRKANQFVFSRKLWILNGIMVVVIALSLPGNIYMSFIYNSFLSLKKVLEVSQFSYVTAYTALIATLVLFWRRSEESTNLLNKYLLLMNDIEKLMNPQELMDKKSILVLVFKLFIALVRVSMYISYAVQTSSRESSYFTFLWVSLILEFNIIQITSCWYFSISTVHWQLYARFSEHFQSFLQDNFQSVGKKDQRLVNMCQSCAISDQLDAYGRILSRLFQICNELNDNFETLIASLVAYIYVNILTDSYYIYFVYEDSNLVFWENTTFLSRKYIMLATDILAFVLIIFVSNSTMYSSRKILIDFNYYVRSPKVEGRLERTVSILGRFFESFFKRMLVLFGNSPRLYNLILHEKCPKQAHQT